MYVKLSDYEYKMLKEIEEITLTDYEIADYTKVENLLSLIEDLKVEYDELLEEFNDWQEKYEAKDMVNWRQQEFMADEMYERMKLGEI